MQISRLTLNNFRGLINSTIDFKPGFNLIVGVNGAGKTAVLDAIRTLMAHALPSLVDVKSYPGIGLQKDDITHGRNQTYVQIDFCSRHQNYSLELSEQREQFRDVIDPARGLKDIRDVDELPRLRHGERPERGDLRLEGTLRGQTSSRPELSGVLVPKPDRSQRMTKPQPLVLYFSVRRAIANHRISKGSKNAAYSGIFDVERGLELSRFEDWWKGREELAREAPQSRSAIQLTTVSSALERLLPHLSNWQLENDVLTVCKIADIEQLDKLGKPVVVQESRRLPISFLSDGERSLIALGADIAQRVAMQNEDSNSPLDDGIGVVLIDELDLHLHPQWQRTIVESLRTTFPNLQFICTTHSPFLIQSQRTGNLVRLDRTGDEEDAAENYQYKSIEDIAEEVQNVEIPQRSQRYLDMISAAEEYYKLLRQIDSKNDTPIEAIKARLDELSLPFSDDPAFQALLKMERTATLGGDS